MKDTIQQIKENEENIDNFKKAFGDVMQQLAVKIAGSMGGNPLKYDFLHLENKKESTISIYQNSCPYLNWQIGSASKKASFLLQAQVCQLQAAFRPLEEWEGFTARNSVGKVNNTNLNSSLQLNFTTSILSQFGSGQKISTNSQLRASPTQSTS